MNCKQGDLARLVWTGSEFDGYIVVCVEPTTDRFTGDPGWIVSPKVGGYRGVRDKVLRPIRPGDISDEEVRDLYAPCTLTKEHA